ncbi:aryl-alcohol dehydrogenase-like predicted oxidoreductase [Kibdelosporangium banguiense]|uniref:Aryl-alcohol dehydrogenase-like predicted oxidoreductase n=1 Tax=Kibdelosporangium banguiense TaxID=1365924 RepID=A0ABS4TRS6_9PSEU|nr:aryl-alcohol dehydrogenase-like predicted oxidoreductase [Kibdelosporangium banguiense]
MLATKFGLPGADHPNHQGASPRWIRRALEASLRRLGTDQLNPPMFDTANPANARRAEIIEALSKVASQAGIRLPQLAHAFVRAHPAVTSVIIGPRTPQQLQDSIAAADIVLSDDVLDAIDAIVPPGTDVNPADTYNATPPSIADPRQRRQAA